MSKIYRLSTKSKRNATYRLSEEEIAARFKRAGVKALEYVDTSSPAKFRCLNCGYEWWAQAFNLMNGHGCKRCFDQRQSKSQTVAAKQLRLEEIDLLGDYVNSHSPVMVRCRRCAYEWKLLATGNKHRCPNCLRRRNEIKFKRRLRCLGVSLIGAYRGTHRHVRIKCGLCGITCRTMAGKINSQRICPGCYPRNKFGREEDRVRKIIERLTGWNFPRTNPAWLKGRGKRPLQLDGYNERHQVAFEYQGYQHYRVTKQFGGHAATLAEIKRRDHRKRCLCYYYGVTLIRVPYWKKDVEAFLRQKLAKLGCSNGVSLTRRLAPRSKRMSYRLSTTSKRNAT